jgi:hypothetical protein
MIPPIEWIYPFLYHSYDWTERYFVGLVIGTVMMGISILTAKKWKWVEP